jgi:dihydroflavonol-4-reductase
MIAITGATGHVGNVLVRLLLESGEDVRVAIPPGADTRMLEGLDLEIFEADILHVPALEHVFHDCPVVFHLDGLEPPRGQRARPDERLVVGSRNVVTACLKTGTGRLVQAIPFGALGPAAQSGGLAALHNRAALEVRRGATLGLDAVIVGLASSVGPHDYGPSPTGRLILNFGRGKFLTWADGYLDLLDAADAAQTLLEAANKGKRGGLYASPGEEVTMREVCGSLQILTGARAPSIKLAKPFAQAAMRLGEEVRRIRLPAGPLLLPHRTGPRPQALGSSALVGQRPRPIRQALVEAVVWFRQRGALPPRY